MRVLLLTQVVPNPPDSGPKVKTHYLLRYLAEHHQVTLVTFVRDEREEAAAAELRRLCAAVYTVPLRRARWRDATYLASSFVCRRPFVVMRDASPALRRLLRGLIEREQFDLVHADQLGMAQFALSTGLPVVFDAHNAVWLLVRRLAEQARGIKRIVLEREWRALRHYERRVCQSSAAVMAVSEEDRAALLAAGSPQNISVIPIAVDIAGVEPVRRHPGADGMLSLATMHWPPNVDGVLWFARSVLPLIRRSYPDAPFYVVGARPPAEVTALADGERVQVTGYVDDLSPYLASSALMVVPLRSGGGMRVKILEALARGIPVVSTSIGAEGIDVVHGQHLLIADDPAEFAAHVVSLLRDRQLAASLAEAGRRHAAQRYDWRHVCPAIEEVYSRAVEPALLPSSAPALQRT